MQVFTRAVQQASNTGIHIQGLVTGSRQLLVLTAAILGTGSAPLMAEQAQEMDDLVITATRLPTPRREVGSSVTVITAEDIQRRQFRSVSDALRSVPGVHVVRSGGPGQQTSVFMRGSNSNHTLVLIDGIEVADPSSPAGAVDFSTLLLDNIERIEVVRGPQSTLYGSDAIGGVIHITTRRGEGDLNGAGKLEGGSDNTFNQQASAAGSTERMNYSFSFTRVDTDGDSVTPSRLRNGASAEDDNHENLTTSARVGMELGDALEFNFFGRYIDSETDLDPELETGGFGTTEDRDAELNQTEYLLRGEAKARLLGGLWDATFSTSYTDYERKNRNDRQEPTETLTRTDFEGDKLKFELKNDFYVHDDHTLTLGVETEKEDMDSGGFSDFAGFIVGEKSGGDTRNSAVYAQDQFSFGGSLFGTLGFRYDDPDDYGTEFTYRFAPAYVIARTGTRIKGSVGTGFKSPTLFQTKGFTPNNLGSFYRGNPDLDSEESFGWELGFEQALWNNRLSLGATWFKSDIDDLMQVVFDEFFNSTYENIDEADIYGVEAFIHASPFQPVTVRLDYTYTDAEEDDTGDRLLRRPKHKLDVDLEYRPVPKARITLAVNLVSDYSDISRETGATVHGDDYTTLDITAEYNINPQWRMFGRVLNATDEHYEPADGFQESDRGFFAGAELKL